MQKPTENKETLIILLYIFSHRETILPLVCYKLACLNSL